MNNSKLDNLRLKIRIGKDGINTIINKIVLKKISNIYKVNNFNSDMVVDFNNKFNEEFNNKFNEEFDELTISDFVNSFNDNFINNLKQEEVKQYNPSLTINNEFTFLDEDRTINDDCSICDTNIDKYTSLNYLETSFNIYKTTSLSKSAIKQYIFYHFIPYCPNYIRQSISYKEIAQYCNVSIPTVKANHKTLEDFGLIETISTYFGKVDFKITDEANLHKSKKNGGKGYVTMSIDMLEHLFSFNNVNELKVELKKLLWVDAKSSSIGKNIRFNKENLINMLPSYIQKSKKAVDTIINSHLSLFNVDRGSLNTLKYQSKNDIDTKFKQLFRDKVIKLFGLNNTAFNKKYADLLERSLYLKDNGYNFQVNELLRELELLKEFTINDICDLIMQYGFNKVKSAIEFMFDDYCYLDNSLGIADNEINNPGAFIRVVIRNNINKFGSLYQSI